MAITVTATHTYDDSTGTYFPTALAADGVTLDTANLRTVLEACRDNPLGGTVILPPGTIKVRRVDTDLLGVAPNYRPALIVYSNTTLIGSRGTILSMTTEADSTAGNTSYTLLCLNNNATNVHISNIEFDGGYDDTHIEMGSRPCIGGMAVSDVSITDCTFRRSPGKHIGILGYTFVAPDPLTNVNPRDLTATSANTSSPVVSSAYYTFVASDVDTYLHIVQGTDWIPGLYRIASVSAGSATLDAAVGKVVLIGPPTSMNTSAGCATVASPTGGYFRRRAYLYDSDTWCTNVRIEDCEFYDIMGNNVGLNQCLSARTSNCFFHDRYTAGAAESLLSHEGQLVSVKNILSTNQFGEIVCDQNEAYYGSNLFSLRNILYSADPRTSLGASMWQSGVATSGYAMLQNMTIEGCIFRYDLAAGDGNGFQLMRCNSADGLVAAGNLSVVSNTTYDTLGLTMSGNKTAAIGNVFVALDYSAIIGPNFYTPGNETSQYSTNVGNIYPFYMDSRGDDVTCFGNCSMRGAHSQTSSANAAWFGNAIVQTDTTPGSSTSFTIGASCTNLSFVGNYVFSLYSTGSHTLIVKTSGTYRCIGAYNRVATSSASGAAGNWNGSKTSTHKNNNSNPSGACNWAATNASPGNYSST